MSGFIYAGPRRFKYFYMYSTLDQCWCEISEEEFDSLVTAYIDIYERTYFEGGQVFTEIGNDFFRYIRSYEEVKYFD